MEFNTVVIRCFSSSKSRGRGRTNNLSLTKSQKKNHRALNMVISVANEDMSNPVAQHGQSSDGVDVRSETHVRFYSNVGEHHLAAK
ncbi:hypothetical protein TNCV_244641 [Trichonephila clavipes]|uniref:Uncharacterized protein n=1 Tax=Trichonephila clavipes TaxID=2585209 RepID=A0A8X6V6F3_TRICX|nr:hypothetical protein TNCV_244641 [Trichonephila clavipes]